MTPNQIKALAGLVVAALATLAAFFPELGGVFSALSGVVGMLAPGLFSAGPKAS